MNARSVPGPGTRIESGGHRFPLKLFVSTVVSTTGTSVNDLLAIKVTRSEQHLWLVIDQRHDAVVGREKSFFAALRCSVILRHVHLSVGFVVAL